MQRKGKVENYMDTFDILMKKNLKQKKKNEISFYHFDQMVMSATLMIIMDRRVKDKCII